MANPSINPLPQAPNRAMARTVYPVVADAWAAAIGPWTTQVNDVVTWMGKQVDAVAASVKAASDSATAAGQAFTDAQAQVKLATDQAVDAKRSADTAKGWRDSAQVSAQAAQAATGLPPDSRPGWVLRQKLDGSGGVEWWQVVVNQVGDTVISTQAPDSTWVPTGRTYPQSALPSLYAKLGAIADWQTAQNGVYGPLIPGGYTVNSIAYGNGQFVAAATQQGYLFGSTDGVSWIQRSNGMPTTDAWVSVDYGNGKFVYVANNSQAVAVSTNGINWTVTSPLPGTSTWRVRFGNGIFLAIAIGGSLMATSTDGVNWTTRNAPAAGAPQYRPIFANGLFVCRFANSLATSPDGVNWTSRTMPFDQANFPVAAIGFANGLFLAVTNSPYYAATSPDGITWTLTKIATAYPGNINQVLASPAGFAVTFLGSSTMYVSGDAVKWTQRDAGMFSGGGFEYVVVNRSVFAVANDARAFVYRFKPYSYDSAVQFYTTDPASTPQGLNQYIKAA